MMVMIIIIYLSSISIHFTRHLLFSISQYSTVVQHSVVTYMPLDFSHRHHHLSLLSSSRHWVSEKAVMLSSSSSSEHARRSVSGDGEGGLAADLPGGGSIREVTRRRRR